MIGMIILHRMIEGEPAPIAFSLEQIVAIYPAVSFGFYGEVRHEAGSYVVTTNDHGENSAPWPVVEEFPQIMAFLPSGMKFGGAAISKALGTNEATNMRGREG